MEIVVGIVALAAVSIVGIVYGAFLFAGSKACFRVVCGGEDFLALCPSDAEFRKSARRSAVAVWMIVAIMWCATASAYACLDDAVRIAVPARRPAEETRWVIRRTLGRAASAGGQRVRKGGWKAGAHAVPEGGEAVWPTGVGARGRRRSEAKRAREQARANPPASSAPSLHRARISRRDALLIAAACASREAAPFQAIRRFLRVNRLGSQNPARCLPKRPSFGSKPVISALFHPSGGSIPQTAALSWGGMGSRRCALVVS